MNILLTSVGRRSYLVNYFKDALKPLDGKVFATNSIETYALQQADAFTLTPQIYSAEYINFLLDYCIKNKITVLISLFDIDLPILAKNKQRFKEMGIDVIVSDPEVIDICNDKWKTYQFLIQHNIKTPTTYISFFEAVAALNNNELTYPVIIKPRWGMGSIGIYKADNLEELQVLYKKVRNEIESSYLKFESSADIDQAILIQQCITSDEYGIEVVNDLQKNYVTTFCKKKLAMRSGETDQAITIENSKLSLIGKKLSSALGHIAMLDSDCLEINGDFYVLELNARFGGQYPFSHLAGANIPKQIVDWCTGLKTNQELTTINTDILCSKDIKPVRL
ncbi:ATP-grasp domain-containing protein [Pseudoalteromonas nigrifaciens]|uniref:ATP-grasp domain-containing protein n=1 Tax=Pseudoalteromonas nigrifaciens TaxID=28109 RepID=UPI001787B997|nr:ATP-grasp domain-containing protein [Pseudoalteromonas nigrifaciens]MBE0421902.1 ATP-grasp domain-containing protein [Pseudoalteromonas nigrifaciens]